MMNINRPTELVYWHDSEKKECEAELLDIRADSKYGVDLIFDRTIFYPQGGGQPCDVGVLKIGEKNFDVVKVWFDRSSDQVVHSILQEDLDVMCGVKCEMVIDQRLRKLNTEYHTGAHVLDLFFRIQNELPFGEFIKGKQFPGDAYMTVPGLCSDVGNDEVLNQINSKLDQLRLQSLSMNTSVEEVDGQIQRMTWFTGYEEFAVGCGGTHLGNTSQLPRIDVFKLKENVKKNTTTFWFRLV